MIDEKALIEDIMKEAGEDSGLGLSRYIPIRAMKEIVENQPKTCEWIPCAGGQNMPPEHDSIFAKFKGTDKWQCGMFEKYSDNVNVTVEFEDGKRRTETLHTIDGEWDKFARALKFKVIAWQPLPDPYKE